MIKSIHFKNFKALRDTTLELGRFTLLIGPNGSGKSTVLQGLSAAGRPSESSYSDLVTAGADPSGEEGPTVQVAWEHPRGAIHVSWPRTGGYTRGHPGMRGAEQQHAGEAELAGIGLYSLRPEMVAKPVELQPNTRLHSNGFGLAVVLDQLRDQHPERFDRLNAEIGTWIPEFDRVLFQTPGPGTRAIAMRTRLGSHAIPAGNLSDGTLLALAILTLAYLPDPPTVVCLEEPDHGLHPRLLQDVRDAIYRLAYPENFGEDRKPVQVIATTHSPYMLDLFRDHPEEIVICRKTEDNILFERLSDRPDLDEILHDTHLGDAWYSGILGGVPADK
ncbi:MAG TPA: AAA family ATPase [Phycisphaerae bacterium]|nr:AAA family ATPase [Phycisphaerae bacterium]